MRRARVDLKPHMLLRHAKPARQDLILRREFSQQIVHHDNIVPLAGEREPSHRTDARAHQRIEMSRDKMRYRTLPAAYCADVVPEFERRGA